MEKKPELFLKAPGLYLKALAQEMAYDSCRRIDGVNASICATDCDKLAMSYFAKECKINGGLFKCCIR